MRLFSTCVALLFVAGASAQQSHPAKPHQNPSAPVTPSSFSAKGLHHEEDLTDFFTGNFADVQFDRGSPLFSALFWQYLLAYARHCDAYLPANKVEMTQQVCADIPIQPTNDDPSPYIPPGCSHYRTVSLGFADPVLYAANAQLDDQTANLAKDMLHSDFMSKGMDIIHLGGDMEGLVRQNACDGPGLRRFQENVLLFAKGKPPIVLPGTPPPVTASSQPPATSGEVNFDRLAEDLVAEQAQNWMFNRYVPGSTSDVIVARDPTGQPTKILAKYYFSQGGAGSRTRGSVTVAFSDGLPSCIYFSDRPTACQTPGRRILARYSSGAYRGANVSSPNLSPAAAASTQPAATVAAHRGLKPPRPTAGGTTAADAATAAAPAATPEQQIQQGAAERQRRAQKAADCRQQAAERHPERGVAMIRDYNSCLEAK
jgi:hypothetical protein